jgi:hypothetical protein
LAALRIPLPAAASLLVLVGVTVVLALASAPAGIGSLEVGAVAALRLLGVDDARALAFALVYHAIQAVPVTLLGILHSGTRAHGPTSFRRCRAEMHVAALWWDSSICATLPRRWPIGRSSAAPPAP